ncbi:hypothetical protein HG463_002365 [Candidatus Saccharibacteria bacterium]|nr:hypothetical protein [Candidatus Saccharibacteria bacterium]
MSKTLVSQSMSVKYLGGSKQPVYLPRIENWNIIPAPGEDAAHFEETLKTFVAFFDDSDEEGSIEITIPFRFTGKLIMSDERRKDAKPITLSNIVRLEKILLAYGNGLVRIYTSTDKIYYFYFEGWSTEARSMMRRLSTRRSIYSSCIPSQKQIELRRRETICRPTLNLISKKKINMD